ncbi:phage holin [Sporosarcina sp. ACRSL]|uniref:phage holin n=1 Tax=Sporosarcina sp. ACRSL TaxID=2918215 RepID=UPI001EF3DF9C|nr:phage holin [Sporosarcina sp. ACRSL]MCG7345296.1 phage holin [Sporosarcina sp. ACRSL]
MRINWKVRFRNPMFWTQIVLAVAVPIGAYFGITGSDITTWGVLFDIITDALSNPYVLFMIGVSVFNAVNDPVVRGISDSTDALRYERPKDNSN